MRVTVCFQLKMAKPRSDGKFPIYARCTLNGQRFEFAKIVDSKISTDMNLLRIKLGNL